MILNDNYLREEVKKLKIYKDIKYSDISKLLGIKKSSFYSYMKLQFNLSDKNKIKLLDIINKLNKEK